MAVNNLPVTYREKVLRSLTQNVFYKTNKTIIFRSKRRPNNMQTRLISMIAKPENLIFQKTSNISFFSTKHFFILKIFLYTTFKHRKLMYNIFRLQFKFVENQINKKCIKVGFYEKIIENVKKLFILFVISVCAREQEKYL